MSNRPCKLLVKRENYRGFCFASTPRETPSFGCFRKNGWESEGSEVESAWCQQGGRYTSIISMFIVAG
jgi:hypothetical protein